MSDLFLSDLGIINALGTGKAAVLAALMRGDRTGIQPVLQGGKTFHLGKAQAGSGDTRLNGLLVDAANQIQPAIQQAMAHYGAGRIAVILGSTDNGAEESRRALELFLTSGSYPINYTLTRQEAHFPARFLADHIGAKGPAFAISTACTSSGSAIANAAKLIRSGACDAVIVGGVDIVSDAVLLGFHALEAVDLEPCKPFSRNRRGINLGEGAALFLLARDNWGSQSIRLLGSGESADAHHMTAPDPTGAGAIRAMRAALVDADCQPADIDYINLHGTGTQLNDAMESIATAAVMGGAIPCSSTKALVGHTLGAASAMELGFCWLALSDNNPQCCLPPQVWDKQPDPTLPLLGFCGIGDRSPRLTKCMSNSYAFGGCNVSLIIGH